MLFGIAYVKSNHVVLAVFIFSSFHSTSCWKITTQTSGLLCDLLWSDPNSDVTGWGESARNVSFHFGVDIVTKFLTRHDLDLVCRAHEVVEDGYEFFGHRQLVTVFSAPNYCDEFNNAGGMMKVDENMICSFQVSIRMLSSLSILSPLPVVSPVLIQINQPRRQFYID